MSHLLEILNAKIQAMTPKPVALTPLFPGDDEPITIEQGEQIGDCYLLACLDTIFNDRKGGRQKINGMFAKDSLGNLVFKIKRSEISVSLKPEYLKGKYGYQFVPGTNEDDRMGYDVFTISPERLKMIDSKQSIGVKTNAMAVKVVEHITSYYYTKTWDPNIPEASILAHSGTAERFNGSCVHFTGNLFSLEFFESYDPEDIDKIIKVKEVCPNVPILIAIDWSINEAGIVLSRHALRLESIGKNDSGEIIFSMRNPQNNMAEPMKMSLADIRKKRPEFGVFATSEATRLLCLALGWSKSKNTSTQADGMAIIDNASLQQFMVSLLELTPGFTESHVQCILYLNNTIPNLNKLFALLPETERPSLLKCVYESQGNKLLFISEFLKTSKNAYFRGLLSGFSLPDPAAEAMIREHIRLTQECNEDIDAAKQQLGTIEDKLLRFPIDFSPYNAEAEIEQYCADMASQLRIIYSRAAADPKVSNLPGALPRLEVLLTDRLQVLDAKAQKKRQAISAKLIAANEFSQKLERFASGADALPGADSKTARTLKWHLQVQLDRMIKQQISPDQFRAAVHSALNESVDTLRGHTGWSVALDDLLLSATRFSSYDTVHISGNMYGFLNTPPSEKPSGAAALSLAPQ